MLLCCIIPSSSGKSNASSRGSKKNFWRRCPGGSCKSRFDSRQRAISGAVAGEVFAQVKTHLPITNSSPSHYIICHLPLVSLSPTSPLPFYSPSLSLSFSILPLYLPLFARLLLVCSCVSLLVCCDGSRYY